MSKQTTELAEFSNNRRTIEAYEGYARQYANAVSRDPSDDTREGLRRLAEIVPKGGEILEVGSGPGWDADFAETLGFKMQRTDVTEAFRKIQQERGKVVRSLDVLLDDFGGPYDAVMAMCVLLNVGRDQAELVLLKVTDALRPGGCFLVSIREGEGHLWERSDVSGDYYVVLWTHESFVKYLASAGLKVEWHSRSVESDGPWLTFLARRTQ